MELHDGETVEYKLSANLRKGIEYVGGVLTITNERFIFVPHSFTLQRSEVSFNIRDIVDFDKSKMLGIVPNGLAVKLSNGAAHNFVVAPGEVAHRQEIVDLIHEKLSA